MAFPLRHEMKAMRSAFIQLPLASLPWSIGRRQFRAYQDFRNRLLRQRKPPRRIEIELADNVHLMSERVWYLPVRSPAREGGQKGAVTKHNRWCTGHRCARSSGCSASAGRRLPRAMASAAENSVRRLTLVTIQLDPRISYYLPALCRCPRWRSPISKAIYHRCTGHQRQLWIRRHRSRRTALPSVDRKGARQLLGQNELYNTAGLPACLLVHDSGTSRKQAV